MSAATPLAAAKGLELVPSATSEHASETGFKAWTQSVQRFTPGPFRPQPVPTKKDNNYKDNEKLLKQTYSDNNINNNNTFNDKITFN
jgi:hypothetical protein